MQRMTRAFAPHPFDTITEAELRQRESAKWRRYPSDVLPVWIAEMDVPLAPPIARELRRALDRQDCGYANTSAGLAEAFAPWAQRRFGWQVEAEDVRLAPDVGTAFTVLVGMLTERGDGVVIDPPAYPPFAEFVGEIGRVVVETPLVRDGDAYTFDLDAIARAYRGGAKIHLLCSPHNPTGMVAPRETLAKIADLAVAHGVIVLSDEIHAPMTFSGATHAPFPTVSEAAARCGIVLTSASKTFNLAGLKAALLIGNGAAARDAFSRLSPLLPFHAGHFGVLAARAAFTEGDEWLASLVTFLDRNRLLLRELLAEALPEVRYQPPQAGYLAWLDCAALADRLTGVGGSLRDPARTFLERGRVALSPGYTYGSGGDGFVRLNFATPRPLLEEAVRRMAASLVA
jgi:cystathionine beta-lyase